MPMSPCEPTGRPWLGCADALRAVFQNAQLVFIGDGALNGRGAGGDCERELRLHAGGEFFFELQDFGGRVCAVPAEWEFCFQDFA